MSGLHWACETVTFPTPTEPEWSDLVERWYQLDAAAFILAETFWRRRAELADFPPRFLLLASPKASNATDAQFALTTPSPAKFVHSLPNIRSAALMQVMKWSGRVLCLQKDPRTLLAAIAEGMHLVEAGEGPVWIVSVENANRGHILILGPEAGLKIRQNSSPAMANGAGRDSDLFSWFSGYQNDSEQSVTVFVAGNLEIVKSTN